MAYVPGIHIGCGFLKCFSPWDRCEEERRLLESHTFCHQLFLFLSLTNISYLFVSGCTNLFASSDMCCSHNQRSDGMGHTAGIALFWWLHGFCENSDFHVLQVIIFKYEIAAVLFYWVSINGLYNSNKCQNHDFAAAQGKELCQNLQEPVSRSSALSSSNCGAFLITTS